MAFWRNRFGPLFIPRYSELAANGESRVGESANANPGDNNNSGRNGENGTNGEGGGGGEAEGGQDPGNDNEYLDIGNLLYFFHRSIIMLIYKIIPY